jgi:hypothetical protein
MNLSYPKILIVSRNVWNDKKGTSSTLTNLFSGYPSQALSQIFIETKMPSTKCCNRFFQISEYSLLKKIFNPKIKTGKEIITPDGKSPIEVDNINYAKKEEQLMRFARRHKSILFSFAREILWLFNGWKSRELKDFIKSVDPDIIWLDGSPLILMNRLHNYVLKEAKKPSVIFLMDDSYTYKSCSLNPISLFYRFILRKQINKVVKQCQKVFVCSPKMKKEYDSIFNINSTFIAKGIDFTKITYQKKPLNNPLKIVYLGQIIYGRIYSLIEVAQTLKKINETEIKAQLFIYTNNELSNKFRKQLEIDNISFIMKPVPYNEVPKVMANADILLFVESLIPKYQNIARLSFSTKIADYLSSGKCIFAIGKNDIAPIEYFKEEDAAIIANSLSEIEKKLTSLINDQEMIIKYGEKAYKCGIKNHQIEKIQKKLYSYLYENSSHINCRMD